MLNLTARSFVDGITSFPLAIGLLLARLTTFLRIGQREHGDFSPLAWMRNDSFWLCSGDVHFPSEGVFFQWLVSSIATARSDPQPLQMFLKFGIHSVNCQKFGVISSASENRTALCFAVIPDLSTVNIFGERVTLSFLFFPFFRSSISSPAYDVILFLMTFLDSKFWEGKEVS
jgi:hypothetical protein